MNWRFLFACGLSVVTALPALSAELSLRLPLGPYYRPGKHLPVHVTAAGLGDRGNKWVGVATQAVDGRLVPGNGALRTTVEAIGGQVDAVVPWLVFDNRAKRPRLFAEEPWQAVDGPELRELTAAERLVGFTTPDDAFARELFGAEVKIVPVALDPATPLPGPAVAWEALDALVLDASAAGRLGADQLATLVASGVTVAVKTDRPSHPAWPWTRSGAYSVLRHAAAGPTAIVSEDAYAPVAGWQAGWPWAFRKRVVVVACVCAALLLGLALWRPPLVALWAVLLCGAMGVLIAAWLYQYDPVQQAAGQVVVIDRTTKLTQTDGWTYQTAARDTTATLRWVDATRPILASRGTLDGVFMTLNCKTDGTPSEFLTRVPAGRRFAFLARSVGPVAPKAKPDPAVNSPLATMAEKLYATKEAKVTGQFDLTSLSAPAYGKVEVQQWNAVVVER